MSDLLLVSIVTPSYNQAQFLEETILSVLNQDYPNIEHIIIDGGSTDGSVDIIRKYENRLAYWVSEPDEGQSHAINKGFAKAHGEIFAWLNSDDTYLPGAVRSAVQFLMEHPDVAVVYGDANDIDDNGELIKRRRAEEFNLNRLYERNFIPQPTAFFRRAAFEEVGGLDINFHYRMDRDLWIKMALKKFKMRNIPYAIANMRIYPDIKTMSTSEERWQELLIMGKRYGIETISPEYVLMRRAHMHLRHGRMFYEARRMREARKELFEAIKLNGYYLMKLRVIILLVTSFFGAGLVIRAIKWKRHICRGHGLT